MWFYFCNCQKSYLLDTCATFWDCKQVRVSQSAMLFSNVASFHSIMQRFVGFTFHIYVIIFFPDNIKAMSHYVLIF